MIRRYRRYWLLIAISLLALPLFVGIVRPDTETMSSDELRDVAQAPSVARQRQPVEQELPDRLTLIFTTVLAYADY